MSVNKVIKVFFLISMISIVSRFIPFGVGAKPGEMRRVGVRLDNLKKVV